MSGGWVMHNLTYMYINKGRQVEKRPQQPNAMNDRQIPKYT